MMTKQNVRVPTLYQEHWLSTGFRYDLISKFNRIGHDSKTYDTFGSLE